jgi:hypothetical protein
LWVGDAPADLQQPRRGSSSSSSSAINLAAAAAAAAQSVPGAAGAEAVADLTRKVDAMVSTISRHGLHDLTRKVDAMAQQQRQILAALSRLEVKDSK